MFMGVNNLYLYLIGIVGALFIPLFVFLILKILRSLPSFKHLEDKERIKKIVKSAVGFVIFCGMLTGIIVYIVRIFGGTVML